MRFPILRSLLPALWLGASLPALATTVVSGHITHPKGATVAVSYGTSPLTQRPSHSLRARLDAKGDFRLELPALQAATEATFAHGDETATLFLTPGDNLRLSLDSEKFDESLRYTGPGAAANNYLAQAYLRFDDDNAPEPPPAASGNASLAERVRHSADADRQRRQAFFGAYAATHPLTPAFRAYVRQGLAFGWANILLFLPIMHPRIEPETPLVLPPGFYDFLPALRPAQDSALASGNHNYREFLSNYAQACLVLPGQPATGAGLLAKAREQFGDGPSRDLVLALYLLQILQTQDATAITALLPHFQRSVRDSAVARTVRASYRQRLPLATGQIAPALHVRNASGQAVSLADFRGKVVYVDFWASWCRPCLAEMPASTALKKQFEGQEVVFLYISIDDEEANWKKALATKPLTSANSVHTWDQGFGGATPSAYQVQSIPAYFLIGRDGRMVSSHAPRPSAGEATAALLRETLRK